MTDQADQELPPAKRRRLILRAVLRGLLVTTVLVVLYNLLPMDRPLDTSTAVRIPIGLLAFAGLTVWQVKAIAGSRYPGLRAAEAVGFGDITAKSETARVALIIQMLADLALLGAGARVLLGAVRRGQQRRSGTGDGAGPAAK